VTALAGTWRRLLNYWVATFGCLRRLKFDTAICERNWKLLDKIVRGHCASFPLLPYGWCFVITAGSEIRPHPVWPANGPLELHPRARCRSPSCPPKPAMLADVRFSFEGRLPCPPTNRFGPPATRRKMGRHGGRPSLKQLPDKRVSGYWRCEQRPSCVRQRTTPEDQSVTILNSKSMRSLTRCIR
jgi:hypothetical protein